jgi:hypothetical protein
MKLPKNELHGSASCPHCANPLVVPSAVVVPAKDQPSAAVPKTAQQLSRARQRQPQGSLSVGISSLKPEGPTSNAPSSPVTKLNNPVPFPTPSDTGDKLKSGLAGLLSKPDSEFPDELDPLPSRSDSNLPPPKVDLLEANRNPLSFGESWQMQPRPLLKEVDFKEKLTTTEDPSLQKEQREPGTRRKKKRRSSRADQRARLEAEGWDNGAPRVSRSLSSRLKNVPWGLVGLMAIGVASAIYWGIIRPIQKNRSVSTIAQTSGTALNSPVEFPDRNDLEKESMLSFLPEANHVLDQFLGSMTVNKLLQSVRDPRRVEPSMRSYYDKNGGVKEIKVKNRLLPENVYIHRQFITGVVELEDYSTKNVILEKTEGGFKVDWESFVAYCDMSWEEFAKEKPTTPQLFRVTLKSEPYFNFEFSDSNAWRSYQLRDASGNKMLWGYAELRSEFNVWERISQAMVTDKDGVINCVLYLKYPPNSTQDNQVIIQEYLETGWAFRPDDYNFQLSSDEQGQGPKNQDLTGGTAKPVVPVPTVKPPPPLAPVPFLPKPAIKPSSPAVELEKPVPVAPNSKSNVPDYIRPK